MHLAWLQLLYQPLPAAVYQLEVCTQFCPESNDLLYPKEDRERRVLVFQCQNCDYKEDADKANWCVYRCVFLPGLA